MVIYNSFNNPKLASLIKAGGIGVIPTDTIYGLVCSAFDQDAVEKVFEIKGRDSDKPPIILISNLNDLGRFGVTLDPAKKQLLMGFWPGKVSVILPVNNDDFTYLSRGLGALTFRFPDNNKLISLLQKTGPLIAPSANTQGAAPATDVDEIMTYFVGQIDFVVDGGKVEGSSSTLIDLTGTEVKVLRQGDVAI